MKAEIYIDPDCAVKHRSVGEPVTEFPDRLTQYDHLNDGGVPIRLDMDDLARQIVAQNYGFVRMCAALCRATRERQAQRQAHNDAQGYGIKASAPLADVIEKAIMQGLYH